MVEMMRKGFFLLAVLVAAGAAEASAQEVTARIAGLEGNAEYMEMLREEASLQAREDSVTMVVNRVRRQLRDDPAQRAVYSAEILRCEEQLFSIRIERGRLTDRINTVEQDWVLANLDLAVRRRRRPAVRRALPCPIRCRRPIWCTTPISANSFRRPTIGRC